MDVRRCDKCGLKWDTDVSGTDCPNCKTAAEAAATALKEVPKKTTKKADKNKDAKPEDAEE